MRFIKLATTHYETPNRPSPHADDIWINLDQVTTITERLSSNSFDEHVRNGRHPVEHYPCLELTTTDGRTHLVSLGSYPDQATAYTALTRFTPTLTRDELDTLLADGLTDLLQ